MLYKSTVDTDITDTVLSDVFYLLDLMMFVKALATCGVMGTGGVVRGIVWSSCSSWVYCSSDIIGRGRGGMRYEKIRL